MKLNLLLLLSLPIAIYAQDSLSVKSADVSPYSSGSKTEKFDNKARMFKDWSVSVGGGGAFIHSADLTSFYDGKINWGWNGYISLDKQISHTFGLSLAYQMGQTNQKGLYSTPPGAASAYTKYNQIALLGDLNLTSLMRRSDNHSPYRWGLHSYAGIGLEGYHTYLTSGSVTLTYPDGNSTVFNYAKYPFDFKQPLALDSFFFEFGAGLLYKINKTVDIEGRIMYIATGDDTFDGGGEEGIRNPYNNINYRHSDNFFTANLGLSFKLGKHTDHLKWFDPIQDANSRIAKLIDKPKFVVCEKGDNDNDGVCDDWDRQLDTPAGARVDGAGVALDMDLDGVIDLNDKCVTVPGPLENNGCPIEAKPVEASAPAPVYTVDDVTKAFEGIEFDLDKDVIRPSSFPKLDAAYEIIKTLDSKTTYAVIGCTDTRASDKYNLDLSQRRAAAVIKYFTSKGNNLPGLLIPIGHGSKDLKYPECNPASKCPEWKNEANRRVYFDKIK